MMDDVAQYRWEETPGSSECSDQKTCFRINYQFYHSSGMNIVKLSNHLKIRFTGKISGWSYAIKKRCISLEGNVLGTYNNAMDYHTAGIFQS
jgi:hypothetical protein